MISFKINFRMSSSVPVHLQKLSLHHSSLFLTFRRASVSSKTQQVKKVYVLLLEREALLSTSTSNVTWKVFIYPNAFSALFSFLIFMLLNDSSMLLK